MGNRSIESDRGAVPSRPELKAEVDGLHRKNRYNNISMSSAYHFRVSTHKGKKYDAVFADGRIVSFGAIKRKGEPYQQYRDRTTLKAYREYDHKDKKRRERYYKLHGPIDNDNKYTADWFSKTFLGDYIATMGCVPSKELKTNLTTDEPRQIVGSTMLQADKIIVLGDSVFLPTKTPEGDSAILEVSISDKKIQSIKAMQIDLYEAVLLR
ncbi:unnamed protein product [Phytophthora fragariaefolia]|uniref:Unnamed protein product n=1 Tax=Phytophthora fragariaefolia TaxID=1490495 RepID=A0A9W6UDD4_9STRA|nr:unnamed protein product [Phytophthora fragariaefolia]